MTDVTDELNEIQNKVSKLQEQELANFKNYTESELSIHLKSVLESLHYAILCTMKEKD